MNTFKKLIEVLFGCFILFLAIAVNIRGSYEGYFGFYEREDELKEKKFYNAMEFTENNIPIKALLSYSGLETGYGFFAPNVASDFVLKFDLLDDADQIISSSNFIDIAHRESLIRISTVYNNFLDYEPGDSTASLKSKYCELVIKSLSINALRDNPEAKSVQTTVYLHHHPTLKQLAENETTAAQLLPIDIKKYGRHEIW